MVEANPDEKNISSQRDTADGTPSERSSVDGYPSERKTVEDVEEPEVPKLVKLRALMEERGFSAFVCFHMDQHNSEYIAACDERIAYISGFDGSNGIVVVTKDEARMWTDGRYYIQAEAQLEEGWTMMKIERGVTNWFDFTAS